MLDPTLPKHDITSLDRFPSEPDNSFVLAPLFTNSDDFGFKPVISNADSSSDDYKTQIIKLKDENRRLVKLNDDLYQSVVDHVEKTIK